MPNIWIGQNMSLSPLHYDSTEGYICQIIGYKKIYLFAPEESIYLYPRTPLTGGRFNMSEVTHLHNIAINKYPHLLHATLHSILLGPGDSLYIPQGWWHQVFNLNYSVAVNFFFTNEIAGYSPKQEILMYQACKSIEESLGHEFIARGKYDLCLENASELLKLNRIDYACYFALAYFEEYLKAHLAQCFFSEFFLKNDGLAKNIKILTTDLYNSRQSNREKYYNNLEQANNFLRIHYNQAHIPSQFIEKWILFSKKILQGDHALLSKKDVHLLIEEISAVCKYGIDKKQQNVKLECPSILKM